MDEAPSQKTDTSGQGLGDTANMVSWLTQPSLPGAMGAPPPMPYLVLLATPLFAVVEDVVTGVIFWEEKGLLDLPFLSHQEQEHQQKDCKSWGV